jgi:hypothetical protein
MNVSTNAAHDPVQRFNPAPCPDTRLTALAAGFETPSVGAGSPGRARRCASGGRWPGKPRPPTGPGAGRTGRPATGALRRHHVTACRPCPGWMASAARKRPGAPDAGTASRAFRRGTVSRYGVAAATRGRRAVARSRERCSGRSAITRCQNQQPQAADYRVIGTRWEPGCGGRSSRSDAALLQALSGWQAPRNPGWIHSAFSFRGGLPVQAAADSACRLRNCAAPSAPR